MCRKILRDDPPGLPSFPIQFSSRSGLGICRGASVEGFQGPHAACSHALPTFIIVDASKAWITKYTHLGLRIFSFPKKVAKVNWCASIHANVSWNINVIYTIPSHVPIKRNKTHIYLLFVQRSLAQPNPIYIFRINKQPCNGLQRCCQYPWTTWCLPLNRRILL